MARSIVTAGGALSTRDASRSTTISIVVRSRGGATLKKEVADDQFGEIVECGEPPWLVMTAGAGWLWLGLRVRLTTRPGSRSRRGRCHRVFRLMAFLSSSCLLALSQKPTTPIIRLIRATRCLVRSIKRCAGVRLRNVASFSAIWLWNGSSVAGSRPVSSSSVRPALISSINFSELEGDLVPTFF